MQAFNSNERYGAVLLFLHWITVLLIGAAWLLGSFGDDLPKGPMRDAGLMLHINAGLAVIVLTAFRLAWRAIDPVPPAEPVHLGSLSGAVALSAKLAHLAIYLLLIVVPVLGVAVQFARGRGFVAFGLFDIGSPWAANRGLARSLKEVHELSANLLMVLAALHAAAAIVHHRLLKDRTLLRMLPG